MSGILAAFNLNNVPVDESVLNKMLASISHRARDGSYLWKHSCAGLGLAYTSFDSRPKEIGLTSCDTRACAISFDGRLDNRSELISNLLSYGELVGSESTDSELALKGYLCWGDNFVERLLGDFAFVLFDCEERRVLCARDILGIKPLYCFLGRSTFLASSELQQLFATGIVPKIPNLGMLAEYLSVYRSSYNETLFANVPLRSSTVTVTVHTYSAVSSNIILVNRDIL